MPTRQLPLQPSAILFDIDGTLVDSLEVITAGLGDTFERYADRRPSREEILALIGMPLVHQLQMFRTAAASDQDMSEMTAFTLARFDEYEHLERPFEPAIQALQQFLDHEVPVALVTSKNAVELDGFLRRFPLANRIKVAISASDVTHPKPAADPAHLALSRLGQSADQAIFIGDSIYDIACAHSAGMAAIGVTYGASTRAQLEAAQPELILERPEQLLDWATATLKNIPCLARS